ncbi:MAG: hypothetical protein JXB26_00915 [Candidatus Aminicenantes bacterium]|nr:hypothetical protein [Candidatus Aminicenantes bacterium]
MKKRLSILMTTVLMLILFCGGAISKEKFFMQVNPQTYIKPFGQVDLGIVSTEALSFRLWVPMNRWLLHKIVRVENGKESLVSEKWGNTAPQIYNIVMKSKEGAEFEPGTYRLYIGEIFLERTSLNPDYFVWYYKYDFTL